MIGLAALLRESAARIAFVKIVGACLSCLAVSTSAIAQLGPTQAELNEAASDSSSWLHPNRDYAGHRYVDLKSLTL